MDRVETSLANEREGEMGSKQLMDRNTPGPNLVAFLLSFPDFPMFCVSIHLILDFLAAAELLNF